MKSFGAVEAEKTLERLLEDAKAGPVAIEKQGQAVAVVLSMEEYSRLEAMEEAYWAVRADKAVARADWVGADESDQALKDVLDAEG